MMSVNGTTRSSRKGAFGECPIKRLQVGCPLVEISQIPPHRNSLIASKRQSLQPRPDRSG